MDGRRRSNSVSLHDRPNIYRDRTRELRVQFVINPLSELSRTDEWNMIRQISATFNIRALQTTGHPDITVHSGTRL